MKSSVVLVAILAAAMIAGGVAISRYARDRREIDKYVFFSPRGERPIPFDTFVEFARGSATVGLCGRAWEKRLKSGSECIDVIRDRHDSCVKPLRAAAPAVIGSRELAGELTRQYRSCIEQFLLMRADG